MRYDYSKAIEMIEKIFNTDAGRAFVRRHHGVSDPKKPYSGNWSDVCTEGETIFDDMGYDATFTSGATKGVIICDEWGFVIKVPFVYTDSYDRTNYCALECAVYDRAVEDDIDKMLAWTEKIGRVYGIPIYAQEKVLCDECQISDSITDKSYQNWVDDGCDDYGWYDDEIVSRYNLDDEGDRKEFFYNYIYDSEEENGWSGLSNVFYDYWDDRDVGHLESFLDLLSVGDLHAGNAGFRNGSGKIVLTDYSGFGMDFVIKADNYNHFYANFSNPKYNTWKEN